MISVKIIGIMMTQSITNTLTMTMTMITTTTTIGLRIMMKMIMTIRATMAIERSPPSRTFYVRDRKLPLNNRPCEDIMPSLFFFSLLFPLIVVHADRFIFVLVLLSADFILYA